MYTCVFYEEKTMEVVLNTHKDPKFKLFLKKMGLKWA